MTSSQFLTIVNIQKYEIFNVLFRLKIFQNNLKSYLIKLKISIATIVFVQKLLKYFASLPLEITFKNSLFINLGSFLKVVYLVLVITDTCFYLGQNRPPK